MSRRTRIFLFVSTGILAVGLAAGAMAAYMGGFDVLVRRVQDGPAELRFVPQATAFVAYADVQGVMRSDVRQKIRALHGPDRAAQDQFEEATGIDISRDVDHVVAFGGPLAGSAPKPPTVILRGRFDRGRLETRLRAQGGQVDEYRGVPMLMHSLVGMSLAFPEDDLLIVGAPAAVRQAIDARHDAGRTSIRSNADLMRLVRDVTGGTAWAVARVDTLGDMAPVPSAIARHLAGIQWLVVSCRVDGGLHGRVRVDARDEAAARDLREMTQGLLAVARLQGGGKPGLSGIVDSLELGGTSRTVTLSFSIPDSAIDALGAASAPQRLTPSAAGR